MRYLVLGSGAVGSYVGGRLALSGQPVLFLGRPLQVDAFRRHGLTIVERGETKHIPSIRAEADLQAAFAAIDPQVMLLAVKAYALEGVIGALRDFDLSLPPLVCLLNGIGNEQRLAETFGPSRILAAALTSAVQAPTPGTVQVEKRRGVGLVSGHSLSPTLLAEMSTAGLNPSAVQDASSLKWSKLLTNLVSNATSAILHWTPSQVYRHPGLCRLELEALRETLRLMRLRGIQVVDLPGVPTKLFARVIGWPPAISRPILRRAVTSGRGQKLPSFVYDLEQRRSEVAWLNGAVARESLAMDIAAPANHLLNHLLSALVNGAEDPLAYRGRPERLLAMAAAEGVPGVTGYNPAR